MHLSLAAQAIINQSVNHMREVLMLSSDQPSWHAYMLFSDFHVNDPAAVAEDDDDDTAVSGGGAPL